jgi:hypothetical protein
MTEVVFRNGQSVNIWVRYKIPGSAGAMGGGRILPGAKDELRVASRDEVRYSWGHENDTYPGGEDKDYLCAATPSEPANIVVIDNSAGKAKCHLKKK